MLPLKNKTILITRSKDQATEFINRLDVLGAKVITLPLIKNTAVNQDLLKTKITQSNYDWIIFTSANAVKYFFETVTAQQVKAKIAVVGTKTAELIKEQGLSIDFTPSKFTAKHLANEIPVKSDESILIPRSSLATNSLLEVLENRGCKVDPIIIYNNHPISYSKEELDKVFSQNVDYITFTSGSIVKSFIATGVKLQDEKIICIGPVTAKVAKKVNLKIHAIADSHTTEGMIKAIVEADSK